MNPLLLTDFYKVHHQKMYPEGMTLLYSNFTPRKSRIPGIDKVVFFGLQHFCLEYLIKAFDKEFFYSQARRTPVMEGYGRLKKIAIDQYKKHIPVDTTHIEALWDLGYLPIEIKAVPEGTLVPIGVPCFTIKNTHPEFAWLTNYLETLISAMMWQPITSATIAYEYKKLLTKYALETTGSADFVQWQGHDFSMRGMSSVESAILSGMGHLLSFTGTDTIPAIYQLEQSYNASGLIGASVPATEHSVMCMGTKESEVETFKRLLTLYPTGILSVVSDTWDLWKVLTEYLPAIKSEILARDGKLVIRPDSGDPVDILCGKISKSFNTIQEVEWFLREFYWETESEKIYFLYDSKVYSVERETLEQSAKEYGEEQIFDFGTSTTISDLVMGGRYSYLELEKISSTESKGVIELLWDLFGGTTVKGQDGKDYKQLDAHIGAIYGDSITLDRAEQICERLKSKGFASTNVVLGIGSYTYQYNTRDTFGFAMKATYGEVNGEGREIFKDPITDDGTKKSKKGLLAVGYKRLSTDDTLVVVDQCTWKQEAEGELQTVFKDGVLVRKTTLEEIRNRLK